MLNTYLKRPLTLARYRSNPAGPHLDAFVLWLEQRGYHPRRILRLIRGLHRFSQWAHDNGLRIEALDAQALAQFRHHLQVRQPLRYPSGSSRPVFLGARHFVTFLEGLGLVSPTAIVLPPPPEPALFRAFRQWMRTHRGTTEATLNTYRRPIIELLHTLGEQPESFDAHALRTFVLERAERRGLGQAKAVVQAVRIFLRFLIAIGRCTPGLDHALPTIAQWRLASLPKYLPAETVEHVLASCDLATPLGVRDRAVLLLLARLGLRAGDVAALQWSDIDWHDGTLRVAGKNRRETRRFARFIAAEDPRHEVPPAGLFCGRRQRPRPYIFSNEEIQQLLEVASRLGPQGSLRPQTYSTLFGLLAVTGMRVSEARNLHLQDVTMDGLLIRETKFHKSRLLPLHATTRTALDRYIDHRRRCAGDDPHLFVTCRGGQLSRTVVSETFHQILKAAGIPHRPTRRRLRLMDLRHTFAVRALERRPEPRHAIGRHTLALTTYMGHACVLDTYWYLETTPQLMTDIATACETFMSGGTA